MLKPNPALARGNLARLPWPYHALERIHPSLLATDTQGTQCLAQVPFGTTFSADDPTSHECNSMSPGIHVSERMAAQQVHQCPLSRRRFMTWSCAMSEPPWTSGDICGGCRSAVESVQCVPDLPVQDTSINMLESDGALLQACI